MGRRVFKKDLSSYAFAFGCVGAAAVVRTLIAYVGGTLYFSTFYPAVLISALYAGTRAGILATIASLGYAWWAFVPPPYEFAFPRFEDIINFTAFAASCAVVIWVAHIANSATANYKLARDELAHRNKNTAAVLEAILRQISSETSRSCRCNRRSHPGVDIRGRSCCYERRFAGSPESVARY